MKNSFQTILISGACALWFSPATSQAADPLPDAMPLPDLNTTGQGVWRLRGAFHIPVTTGSLVESDDILLANRKASPFQLSYEHDAIADQTTMNLKGALFYSWGRDVDDGSSLKVINYAVGVALDQSSVGGEIMTDTVAVQARMAALYNNSDSNVWIKNHFVEGGVGWLTDRDFELSVLTLDARYTPLAANFGNFGSRAGFHVKVTPSMLIEGQRVFDAAGVANFQGDQDRLFAGADIDITAGFGSDFKDAKSPLSRLSFGLGYSYMYDLTGGNGDRDLLDASINWALTDDRSASLSITYSKGQSTISDPVDKLTVGFGFAF